MRILLDTHMLLGLIDERTAIFGKQVEQILQNADNEFHVSVASLREIAIKWRLRKLKLTIEPSALPSRLADLGIELVIINQQHVLADVAPEPPTRDPFDRLLLAQSLIEGLRLLTVDRALVGHPLAVPL